MRKWHIGAERLFEKYVMYLFDLREHINMMLIWASFVVSGLTFHITKSTSSFRSFAVSYRKYPIPSTLRMAAVSQNQNHSHTVVSPE